MSIPPQVLDGVAEIIRSLCNKDNDYRHHEFVTIGEYQYKLSIILSDVDEVKEAKTVNIILKREN